MARRTLLRHYWRRPQQSCRHKKNSDVVSLKAEDDKTALRDLALGANKLICRITAGEASQKDIDHTIESLGNIVNDLIPSGPGNHFDDYKAMYKTLELDVVCEHDQFLTDEIFGWYRIGGANCMRLMKITDTSTKFPQLTDQIFRSIKCFENDSLHAAAATNRLYYVEYPEFHGIPDTKPGMYVYSPLALFAVPRERKSIRESLLPIAIHCKPGLPMFTPNSDNLAWIAAKSTVQTTDALTQTVMYHLGRCHLLIEVFNCATHRALAENHPLYKLLLVHFAGTALMNYAATKTLIQDGNQIDEITSPPMEYLRQLAAKCINSPDMFNFNKWMVDNELAGREVMSENLMYPYRDDALRIWNAIMSWARSYISAYYSSDADVEHDHELQQWCFEIHDRSMEICQASETRTAGGSRRRDARANSDNDNIHRVSAALGRRTSLRVPSCSTHQRCRSGDTHRLWTVSNRTRAWVKWCRR